MVSSLRKGRKGKRVKSLFSLKNLIVFWAAATLFVTSAPFVFDIEVTYLILIGMLLVIFDILFYRRFPYTYNIVKILPLILFFSLCWLGLALSMAPNYGYTKIYQLTGWIIYFVFLAGYIKENIVTFFKVNIILFLAYIILVIVYFGSPLDVLNEAILFSHRLGATYGDSGEAHFNPIWLSRYIGFLVLSLFMYRYGKKFSFLWIGVYIIAGLYMMASGSKGPILALLLSIVYALFVISKKKLISRGLIASMFLLGATLVFNIQSDSFLESRFSLEGRSTKVRIDLIEKTLDATNENIGSVFFGTGTGSLGYVLTGRDMRDYPHNIFVEIYGENGMLGILFFLLALLPLWKKFKNNKERMLPFFCFFLFFFLNAQVSGDLRANQFLFLFYLILIVDGKSKNSNL